MRGWLSELAALVGRGGLRGGGGRSQYKEEGTGGVSSRHGNIEWAKRANPYPPGSQQPARRGREELVAGTERGNGVGVNVYDIRTSIIYVYMYIYVYIYIGLTIYVYIYISS